MKFTKMHGCGNDYVYVNLFEEKIADPAKVSIAVSDRHFGIGSDGLITIGYRISRISGCGFTMRMARRRRCVETESAVSQNMYMIIK